MKNRPLILIIGIIFSINTFQAQNPDWEQKIIGNWIFTDRNEKEFTLLKIEKFDQNKSGFAFFEDGSFIYHGFSGFCATPPVYLSDLRGTWKKINNEVLTANYKNWDGIKEFEIFVKSVDDNKLIIQFVKNEIENK